MRILIYLVMGECVHPSFTKPEGFNVQGWVAQNDQLLKSYGITRVEYEEVPDADFRLEHEE